MSFIFFDVIGDFFDIIVSGLIVLDLLILGDCLDVIKKLNVKKKIFDVVIKYLM